MQSLRIKIIKQKTMSDQNLIAIGLFFGIVSTLCVHLGKAMERQGIEIYSKDKKLKDKGKKPIIYLVGVVFNNSVVLWQILSMQFTSAAVFSSVFGLGLILLMLYSHYILHEEIQKSEIFGAMFIIVGTTMIGFIQLTESPNPESINFTRLYLAMIVIILILLILFIYSLKTGFAVAIVFGIVAGTFGGLDNIFKRIGLKNGINEVGNLQTLPYFILSFFLAISAFLICQYGFAKGAEASKLVPIYNSFYIIFPVIFELIISDHSFISIEKIIALIMITFGVFFMHIFRNPSENIEISYEEDLNL